MKTHNLLDLLGGTIIITTPDGDHPRKIDGITIPIIQRDYAQGRPDEDLIRGRFLTALFTALEQDNGLELDFIYGSVKKGTGETEMFLPLDGQQRLTTLFLLYWVVSNNELGTHDRQLFCAQLARFSYATRSTARDFCQKLAHLTFTSDAAGQIRKAYWFHNGYAQDPTVKAMLRTIADIEARYANCGSPLFASLARLCFYILPLDGFRLTDELYIKMNARGKQLTGFENFKADLIGWMKSDENPDATKLARQVSYGKTLMPHYLAIASKTDNSWTDIFWPVARAQPKEEDKIVDPYYFRFINRYVLNEFIVRSDRSAAQIETSETFTQLYGDKGSDALPRYREFTYYRPVFSGDFAGRFERAMDQLAIHQESIRAALNTSLNSTPNWFIYDESISQVQRILLAAVTGYLEEHTYDIQKFKEWIRVVWNIIIDPDIRSIGAMIAVMKTVASLAAGSGDIYAYFKTPEFTALAERSGNIQKEQLAEEKLKAGLFENEGWEQIIKKAEAHPLFQGNIGFLLLGDPTLAEFEHRFATSALLFSHYGANKAFRQDRGLYRYLISALPDWSALYAFTYADDFQNWQLILRRNQIAKTIINELCGCESEAAMQHVINAGINRSSAISGWDNGNAKLRLIHTNLYFDERFVDWTQKENKLTKVKELYGHRYLIRPSAWFDKVMIDNRRNEVINLLCQHHGARTENRCGSTQFFWGEDINVYITRNGHQYLLEFTRDIRLRIRIAAEADGLTKWTPYKAFDELRLGSTEEAAETTLEIVNSLE
ncbi:DUF262 domain-containing protein [Mucilaginibacter sp. PAMB04168]|uniref:DUF262 domain-containing protein n=1 Tax=Mucilaginibacter sp. PAMB04168 TaxID=3138567 RepID=UPI0031F6440A